MRRRLFNLFAFTCLAFALYLIVFSREDPTTPQASNIARATGAKVNGNTH
jgi:hypothetical protein